MVAWFSSMDMVNSRCGFCNVPMTTWAERQKHLASHFKQGTSMKEWKGDRGFDAHIDDLVENDMPAFMIGEQHDTMEPFSASQASHVTGRTDLDVSHLTTELTFLNQNTLESGAPSPIPQATAHSYRQVESLLLAFVSEELSRGRVPTDGQLRTKTSEIMYGPGNAWDQTWADNLQWLGLFKKKVGLIELPHGSGKNAFIGTDSGLDNSEGDGSALVENAQAGHT
ncbi:hypothetical protein B0J13DRAFT_555470 [Dactylonectria estremocensis]|uniref:C2H2-type domain-containing protein n=1 Tax=Dactylonectria estremocensis TaxID=1079267 RepID=A0A9P9EU95_9HYPO|nr:hypothetical protein B0J13DRAFT_555470 [Dactylonectria estremocensis]